MAVLTSSQATFTNVEEYSEIIIGTQTASTGSWKGVANLLPPLKDGQQITYWLPYAGSGNATLNLTLADGSTTGAVNCYYSGTTRLTTHYAAGNAIHMTYRKDAKIGSSATLYTGWWADANYTTGDNNQLRIANSIKAKTAITANRLIVGDSGGFFHLAANLVFDVNKPIIYRTSALSAGSGSTSGNYISYSNVALANNLTGFSGTSGESCYIVGTLEGTVFTPAETFFTTTQPTEADGNGKILAQTIMRYMNAACDRWTAETSIAFSIYGTPLESTTYKFAKCLQRRFGIIPGVTDKNYITNSYHIHVTEEIDAFRKLAFEAEFQALSKGGAVSYVEVPNLQQNIPAVLSLIQFIYNNIMYAELNTRSDYCQKCGYEGEIIIVNDNDKLVWECPCCHNRDQNTMNVTRRTCGYSGTQYWNQGRTQEINERKLHL